MICSVRLTRKLKFDALIARFAKVQSLTESGKALRNLSLTRAALWGMLGAAIFPMLTGRANQVFWTCPFGALIGTALVALAQRVELREATRPKRLRALFFACVRAPVQDAISPLKESAT